MIALLLGLELYGPPQLVSVLDCDFSRFTQGASAHDGIAYGSMRSDFEMQTQVKTKARTFAQAEHVHAKQGALSKRDASVDVVQQGRTYARSS
ncbi:hypothetical protein ATO7_07492 [Oceanococcus atlanticus]|uniref:Uncharacterized protein n=1 Tax=Oceanococcus atlanticus TaxID=1317117 RepID=A0A1Y1SCY1_9GAMM|nr:hypothetical protein ATO7_07492 [Oceanococcus atlanticus]